MEFSRGTQLNLTVGGLRWHHHHSSSLPAVEFEAAQLTALTEHFKDAGTEVVKTKAGS